MKLLMENWRNFINEVEKIQGSIDNTVFLFEGKTIIEEQFDVLVGRLDKNEITLIEFNEAWNRSLLYELKQLNEVNPLAWTKEKLVQASDAVKQQVAHAYNVIASKVLVFVIKAMNQAIIVASKTFDILKRASEQVNFKIWEGVLRGVGLLLKGAAKAAKFFGPVFVHLGRALLCATVGAIFFAAEAMGADAATITAGLDGLISSAIDILQVTLESMGESGIVGGEHAGDVETITIFDVETVLDGEALTVSSDASWDKSNSEANTMVRAQQAMTQALHGMITSYEPTTGENVTWDLERIMSTLDPATQEAIELAMDDAQDLRTLNPEAAQLSEEAGKKIKILWDGDVKKVLHDYMQETRGPEGDSTFSHASSYSRGAGTKYGIRGS